MSVATLHLPSLRGLASSPRRGLVEVATLVGLYGIYELVRGQGNATLPTARAHTDEIVALERHLHLFGERAVQNAAHVLPGLPTLLGAAYITLHFLGTAVFLVWLHRRHREHFPLVRNTLVIATGIALAIYLLYPVAPPRLAGLGMTDAVSEQSAVALAGHSTWFYNPIAAVPSLHFGYALLVGIALARIARRRIVRLIGWIYPAVMLIVIVATGNHFFFDAAAGGIAIAAGFAVASWIGSPTTRGRRWQSAEGSAAALC